MPSCFVIMSIGDQDFAGCAISAESLRKRYDDLIKEALLKADPALEVMRADEVALPGTITSDIIARLMHAEFVVADVTFPNPNVFYELGLRHACRAGTIVIRDRSGPPVPFDIASHRRIDYDDSSTGLKELSERLKTIFAQFRNDPARPDNQFLEHAKLTHFQFPAYQPIATIDPKTEAIIAIMKMPELLELFVRHSQGENVEQAEVLRLMAQKPELAELLIRAMVETGEWSVAGPARPPRKARRPRPPAKRSNRRKR